MAISFDITLYNVLLAGYVLCFILLNCIAYLMASFYRKRVNQRSMRAGFLIAISCLLLYIPCLFLGRPYFDYCSVVQALLLMFGSCMSIWNAVALYLTMKKVRK
jgi:hypothetical protein